MNGYDFASVFLNKFGAEGVEKMLYCALGGETDWLEFKASSLFDPEKEPDAHLKDDALAHREDRQRELDWNIALAVIAIHNTRGGVLIVGVDDSSAFRSAVPMAQPDEEGLRRDVLDHLLGRSGFHYTDEKGKVRNFELSRALDEAIVEPRFCAYQGERVVALLVRPVEAGGLLLSVTPMTNGRQAPSFVPFRERGHVGKVIRRTPTNAVDYPRGLGEPDLAGILAAFNEGRSAFFGPVLTPEQSEGFFRLRVDRKEGGIAACFAEEDPGTTGKTYLVDLGACNLGQDLIEAVEHGDVLSLAGPEFIEVSGRWRAQYLVWNPDYLFSPEKLGRASIYAFPGVKYWLDVFKPTIPPDQANKGVFANQALADCLCLPRPDLETVRRDFFSRWPEQNALGVADEVLLPSILDNIRQFVRPDAPNSERPAVESWRTEVPMVFPELGLSAKADAVSVSRDDRQMGTFSLEIKAGKWNTYGGGPRTEHFFQPSVYSAFLASRAKGRQIGIRSCLRYPMEVHDKYVDTRIGFEWSPVPGTFRNPHVRDCAAVRNEALLFERRLEENPTFNSFAEFNADCFRKLEDRFFDSRKFGPSRRDQIRGQLDSLNANNPLAMEWASRFLSFAAKEDRLARIGGSNDEDRACQADAWRLTLPERIKRGLSLPLQIRPQTMKQDRYGRLIEVAAKIRCDARETFDVSLIRDGDTVFLYPDRGPSSNIANSLPFAAVATHLTPDSVCLRLEEPLSKFAAGFDAFDKWIAEIRNDYGQDLLFRGCFALLDGVPRRRDLLLGLARPEYDANADLPEIGNIPENIRKVLHDAWRAKDYYLVWGPPGTGKTHSMIRTIVEASLAADADGKILLLSYTNRAADELCDMLTRLERERLHGLDWWRIGNAGKCPEEHLNHFPSRRIYDDAAAVKEEFSRVRVFVGTISSVKPDNPIFKLDEAAMFKLAIVDEASQLLEPQATPLFCARRRDGCDEPLIGKFVFVGDDRQLPAVVQQTSKESEVEEGSRLRTSSIKLENLRDSLFERLHRLTASEPHRCGLLYAQHRMPPVLSQFVSRAFYGKRLQDDVSPGKNGRTFDVPADCRDPFERFAMKNRLGFVEVRGGGRREDPKSNPEEAALCASIVDALRRFEFGRGDGIDLDRYIGIVVPFRKQIAAIRTAFRERNIPEDFVSRIPIDTIERFQGAQCRTVIYSTVVGNEHLALRIQDKKDFRFSEDGTTMEFSSVDRKLNVAISRAAERFILLGNETVLKTLPAYKAFIDYIRENGAVWNG